MATGRGLGIVTDGLVLCLDAANKDSYPGSGTTWFDLSGNGENFRFLNSPIFSSNNLGNITLGGTNEYLDSTTFYTSTYWSENGPFTIVSFHKITGAVTGNGRSAIFANQRYYTETNNSGPGGFGINIYSNGYYINLSHDDGQGTTTSDQNIERIDITTNEVECITYTWNPGTTTIRGYKNGIETGSSTNASYQWSPRSSGLATRIGTSTQGGWGNYFPGEIYSIFVYNRTLNDSEVLNTYNATKSRFGL